MRLIRIFSFYKCAFRRSIFCEVVSVLVNYQWFCRSCSDRNGNVCEWARLLANLSTCCPAGRHRPQMQLFPNYVVSVNIERLICSAVIRLYAFHPLPPYPFLLGCVSLLPLLSVHLGSCCLISISIFYFIVLFTFHSCFVCLLLFALAN